MKTSAFSQAGLLLFGGTLVLLIGALVKFDPDTTPAKTPVLTVPVPTPESSDDSRDDTNDLPLPANFPANLAQVVKLTRAGLREDVILAYVQNSGERYAPTADEMIYLHQSGVAEKVLAALVKQKSKPAPSIAESGPPANSTSPPLETASDDSASKPVSTAPTPAAENTIATPSRPAPGAPAAYFYDDLAPYGDWVQTSDSNWAWQPTVVQAVPNWQPYRDDGQWEYTDSGWYWQSSYPWGWAAFHYGGWYNDSARGWLWQPGNNWAPAWVAWRKTSSHFGWAPLPPGVSFNMAFAVQPNNIVDYGLTPSSYTFVPAAHFLSHNLAKYAAPASKATTLLASSISVTSRNHNLGIPPEEVAAASHNPIRRLQLSDANAPTSRAPGISSHDLAVYRPNPGSSSSASRQDSSSKTTH